MWWTFSLGQGPVLTKPAWYGECCISIIVVTAKLWNKILYLLSSESHIHSPWETPIVILIPIIESVHIKHITIIQVFLLYSYIILCNV